MAILAWIKKKEVPPLSWAGPAGSEEGGADADVRGALFDRHLEVVAHSHRQAAGPARPLGPAAEVVAQLAQAPEPWARFLGGIPKGRDGHQPDDAHVGQGGQ